MKFSTLAMAGTAAAVALPEPQLGSLLGGLGGSGLSLVKTTEGKPIYRPTAKREQLRYGPIELAGRGQKKSGLSMSMDKDGQAGIVTISKGLCKSCTVLGGKFVLSYENGEEAKPANGLYIHHLVSYDNTKSANNPIGSCGALGKLGGSGSLPIAAFIDMGEDSGETETVFTTPDGKYDSGYHMNTNNKFAIQYDLVPYSNKTQNIYITLDYEYVPGIVGKDAGHTLKSVTGCGSMEPKLDRNGPSSTKVELPINSDATIIWARGHLHAGGDKMVLTLNGKDVCDSKATYDDAGVITNMGICSDIKIKKGDKLGIESIYDLKAHKLRQSADGHGDAHGAMGTSDVMGMVAMSYAVDAPAAAAPKSAARTADASSSSGGILSALSKLFG